MTRTISFTLPAPFPLVNRTTGYSHFTAARQKNQMQRQVAAAAYHLRPSLPFERAHVLIERHSVGTPDTDNLWGSAKRLLDCLTTPALLNVRKEGARQRTKNKRGLGFIVDDAPRHLTLEVRGVKCRLCEQKTVVTITEIMSAEVAA
ncbi:hypothetical protein [Gluconobacter wancherniae]|uniref:Uncharacterized protein n=1 Tax=Gluconobacter wancherniae NBRC 103581 TaxID=656744 RepID=A0A511AY96_9PROT|nr:hypothetical protein [Gluconobacter wancherniae]MBF0853349.1 hypothetical protein [Gluconobacter wancherniae]GBR65893.1 hypothetical protein AA103581_2061 [Gluconobacter wancherniae NBRC 103581]GEK93178.1 hypothetical protein GWA01_09480 [Gluconobacter wancherniae NBRC 103581]